MVALLLRAEEDVVCSVVIPGVIELEIQLGRARELREPHVVVADQHLVAGHHRERRDAATIGPDHAVVGAEVPHGDAPPEELEHAVMARHATAGQQDVAIFSPPGHIRAILEPERAQHLRATPNMQLHHQPPRSRTPRTVSPSTETPVNNLKLSAPWCTSIPIPR